MSEAYFEVAHSAPLSAFHGSQIQNRVLLKQCSISWPNTVLGANNVRFPISRGQADVTSYKNNQVSPAEGS